MKSFKINISKLEIVLYAMLGVFSVLTMTASIWLGLAELVFSVFYVVFNILSIDQRNRHIYSYLQNITSYLDEATRENLTNFPMPITLLNDKGEIIWYNELFHQVLHDGNIHEIFGQKVLAINNNISFENVKKS